MEELFQDMMNDLEIYLDDIGIFHTDSEAHLRVLNKVKTRLQDHAFTVKPDKCEWAVKEANFLGFWLTPFSLKQWPKKVEAIRNIDEPKTLTT